MKNSDAAMNGHGRFRVERLEERIAPGALHIISSSSSSSSSSNGHSSSSSSTAKVTLVDDHGHVKYSLVETGQFHGNGSSGAFAVAVGKLDGFGGAFAVAVGKLGRGW